MKGHIGPSGKGKCKTGLGKCVVNSFIENTSLENENHQSEYVCKTPPPRNSSFLENHDTTSDDPRSDIVTPPPSGLDLNQEITLTPPPPVSPVKKKAKDMQRKAQIGSEPKKKKPRASGLNYFRPMQVWKNVYSKENLVEPLKLRSNEGRTVCDDEQTGIASARNDQETESEKRSDLESDLNNSMVMNQSGSEEIEQSNYKGVGSLNDNLNDEIESNDKGDDTAVVPTIDTEKGADIKGRGRPRRKCKEEGCLFCLIEEDCGSCVSCSKPNLKQKCILR